MYDSKIKMTDVCWKVIGGAGDFEFERSYVIKQKSIIWKLHSVVF